VASVACTANDMGPAGDWAGIEVACGTYPEPINIYYFRTISIIGVDQNCVFLRAATPGSIAWVQDHATATFMYVTFLCDNGGLAVASRQYTITDLAYITMDGCDVQVAASEDS
jgi:hypothetical protein